MSGGIALLLALGLTLPGAVTPFAPTLAPPPGVRVSHEPIFINGDFAFEYWTSGVIAGNGSVDNPYLIANWDIDATTADGIHIGGTSAAFRISNVTIRTPQGAGAAYYGIHITNVAQGMIDHVNVTTEWTGVWVDDSSRVVLADSTIVTAYGGVAYHNVTGGLIERNAIQPMYNEAIVVGSSSDVVVQANSVTHLVDGWGGSGIVVYEATRITLTDNTVYAAEGAGRWGYGIDLWRSTFVDIERNSLYNRAVFLNGGWMWAEGNTAELPYYTSNTITSDNRVNGLPILFYKDKVGLVLDGNLAGELILANVSSTTVTNQYFFRSEIGVLLAYSRDVVIRESDFSFMRTAVSVQNSKGVRIYRNNFNSAGADVFGWDIQWNLPYPEGGNFWSSYSGYDRCSGPDQIICPDPDGFGDIPKWIDELPVMRWINHHDRAPVACAQSRTEPATVDVDIVFDARCSSDPDGSAMTFRWDWNGDWRFDTNRTTNATETHRFRRQGVNIVHLEVRDATGRIGILTLSLLIQAPSLASSFGAWVPWILVALAIIVAGLEVRHLRSIRARRRRITRRAPGTATGEPDQEGKVGP